MSQSKETRCEERSKEKQKESKIRLKETRPIKRKYFDNEFPVRIKSLCLLTIEKVAVST